MNVLWEANEDLNFSQIAACARDTFAHGWSDGRVKRMINNIIKKGAAESYTAGQEIRYRARIQKDAYARHCFILSEKDDPFLGNTVFDYTAALTAEDELTGDEYDELQRMIEDLENSRTDE